MKRFFILILGILIMAAPVKAQTYTTLLDALNAIAHADSASVRLDALIAHADSLVALLSAVTDPYGVMPSTGRVTTIINEGSDDIAYGTPKYYSVPMAGYSRCTLKCLFAATTTSIPTVGVILSETSDITLATGNPAWFDPAPADSMDSDAWTLQSIPTSDLGVSIPVMNAYGAWATADYIIVKVTASTETTAGIQDFKLIAIKEQ